MKWVLSTVLEILDLIIILLGTQMLISSSYTRKHTLLIIAFDAIGIILCKLLEFAVSKLLERFYASRIVKVVFCCLTIVLFAVIFYWASIFVGVISGYHYSIMALVLIAITVTANHLILGNMFDRRLMPERKGLIDIILNRGDKEAEEE